ncbi:hypothetical protein N752_24845 [Desulforamulus aquiferis]|nr:hypothetical protein N752_24845 [Desulforamulus aquiferis]
MIKVAIRETISTRRNSSRCSIIDWSFSSAKANYPLMRTNQDRPENFHGTLAKNNLAEVPFITLSCKEIGPAFLIQIFI